ncbi:autophagy-related protein 16-2 isoform X2 [Lacerta agilis]|uniref:autophagy-related protein 16-2 isoform X2 n=1 Tax=Lacerta agilis TaxID=80427 RepID=UPI00141A314A|nr:autophagy-related protein 16-2 isoform X2 [Lacerta agilis]
MAESGGGSARLCRRCWKRHIVRQLQQRDRAQKARFLDLVQAYNKLLEKSNLENLTAKLQAKSLDNLRGFPPRPTQETPDCFLGAVLGSAETTESLKGIHERHLAEVESINGQLAYSIYEWNLQLKAKDAELEEQRGRLAGLSGQVSELEAEHRLLREQVEELSRRTAAMKDDYGSLHQRYRQQDADFRQAVERGLELLTCLMQKKAEAAEHRNKALERAKQDRLAKELKKAVRTPVGIKVEPEDGKADEQKMPRRDAQEESGEKMLKRPFRSASATSMTLTRYVGVFKGLFDFRMKRGSSFSSPSEERSYYIPSCAAACLPSRVRDEQEGHASEINAARFSPNSSVLATGGADKLIRLWDVAGGRMEKVKTLEGANGGITSVEFDPSGFHVLAGTYNNAAQLWKVDDCHFKEVLTGHTDKVTAARFRATRHQAVTGSRDRTVKEWDLTKGACYRTIGVFSYCNDIVCCDTFIISGHHDKTIRFWDSRDPRCTQVIPVEGKVTSLSISPDQMHLLSCSRDNALKVIDLRMHNIRQVFRAEGFKCGSDGTKAVFSPDKSYALVGSADGALYLWNMETGKLETSLPGVHSSPVNAVAWSPSGAYIGSVDRGRKVVLWS